MIIINVISNILAKYSYKIHIVYLLFYSTFLINTFKEFNYDLIKILIIDHNYRCYFIYSYKSNFIVKWKLIINDKLDVKIHFFICVWGILYRILNFSLLQSPISELFNLHYFLLEHDVI